MPNAEQLEPGEGSADMLAAAIQQASVAIAVCDRNFRPYLFNDAARALLNIADGPPAQGGASGLFPHVAGVEARIVHAAIERHGFWRETRPIPSGNGSDPIEADIEVSAFRAGAVAGLMIVAREVEPATARARLASDAGLIAASAHLTPREKQVMLGLLAGQSSKEIGKELALSPRTVEFHRAKLTLRYGARSLVDLLQKVIHDEAPERRDGGSPSGLVD